MSYYTRIYSQRYCNSTLLITLCCWVQPFKKKKVFWIVHVMSSITAQSLNNILADDAGSHFSLFPNISVSCCLIYLHKENLYHIYDLISSAPRYWMEGHFCHMGLNRYENLALKWHICLKMNLERLSLWHIVFIMSSRVEIMPARVI